ncbi:MAG: hypothetical protein KAT77_04990 [Nanoarchaeota archaeon]|nr:hypothetical protein [Nanoarchaeota archaeon]
MKKQKRYQKQIILLLLVIFSVLLVLPSASSVATSGSIIKDSDNSIMNVPYDSNVDAHVDNTATVPNAALRINGSAAADVANLYTGGLYAVGTNPAVGNFQYVIMTTDGDPDPLMQTGAAQSCPGSACYARTGANLAFPLAIVGSDSGNPGAAFFPGNIYVVVSSNKTVEDTDALIYLSPSDGELTGTYTVSSSYMETYYVQSTGNTRFDVTGISTGAYSDHSSSNYLACGLCNDTRGHNCSDTTLTSPGAAYVTLNTDIVLPADSYVHYKYGVVNGRATSFCIGPDLDITAVSANPSTGPPGTSVNVSATVLNDNNVNVTQAFTVDFYYDSVTPGNKIGSTQTITGLGRDDSTNAASVLWDTTGITSGAHILYGVLDDAGIGDCGPTNDNHTGSFTTELVYYIFVDIDGVRTDNFTDAGRPYNVSLQVNNSNNAVVPNTIVRITEENGISLLAPLQTYTSGGTKYGVKPVSKAEVITDSNGRAYLALIPTGNKLYTPGYEYTNLTDHVGNYSLYIEIFNSAGTELQLMQNGVKVNEYNLTLFNMTNRIPTGSELYSLGVYNQDAYVKTFLNFAYQIFATARQWIAS